MYHVRNDVSSHHTYVMCHSIKPGFHSNAIACVGKQPIMVATASRNKRKRQPIGMLGQSSGNHHWLLANASDCVWMETGLNMCVCVCVCDFNRMNAWYSRVNSNLLFLVIFGEKQTAIRIHRELNREKQAMGRRGRVFYRRRHWHGRLQTMGIDLNERCGLSALRYAVIWRFHLSLRMRHLNEGRKFTVFFQKYHTQKGSKCVNTINSKQANIIIIIIQVYFRQKDHIK